MAASPSGTTTVAGGAGRAAGKSIEVHQNWLARLFRVKPAKSYLCFGMSRVRARQEIVLLLRQWRKYGIKDVQVDKERNIVFARLGPHNCEFTWSTDPVLLQSVESNGDMR